MNAVHINNAALINDKAQCRRRLRKARQSLMPKQRAEATQRINRQLKRWIKRGSRIGVYWPIGSELRLDEFVLAARQRGAEVVLPYIEPNSLRLWFTPYQPQAKAERMRGRKSLRIPPFAGLKIRAHDLNVLLMPLVGIDQQGYRLGQGGGYYDVTLAATWHRLQPRKIAVGFGCQMCESLAHEAHDIRADVFVSEHGVWRFR